MFDSFDAMGEIVDAIDTIHRQSDKFVTGVENKATGDSKPNIMTPLNTKNEWQGLKLGALEINETRLTRNECMGCHP